MRQVLFEVFGVPIYGYGLMLFFAFVACNFLASRLSRREGIDPKLILDWIIWLFVTGIVGARIFYVIQYWHSDLTKTPPYKGFDDRPLLDTVKLWDGGLVFYGSIFGGLVGYGVYHWFFLRPHKVSHWKMLDVHAPCIAVGLALGRVGCLFTGCCYGNVACEEWRSLHFPLHSTPTVEMVNRGLQTPLGIVFAGDSLHVEAVEPGSRAEAAGVQAKDTILSINEFLVLKQPDIASALYAMYKTNKTDVTLTVQRGAQRVEIPAFAPASIGLNPTQVYETISMGLLLFFLLSYYRYKRHDGELMVFLMFGYGVHRFLNEMLRTDTDPVWGTGLTISQNISLIVIALGAVLAVAVWRRPLIADEAPAVPDPVPPLAA